jgi:hypothetical protein
MLANGTHGQPAGTATDDTDLALCIARSLTEQGAFDGQDIADRFVEWYDDGPFDIGLMTADAISEYKAGTSWRDAGREVWQGRPEGSNAGRRHYTHSSHACSGAQVIFKDRTRRTIDSNRDAYRRPPRYFSEYTFHPHGLAIPQG